MDDADRNRRWALVAGALLVAGGLGYALAKLTNRPSSLEATPTAPSEAVKTADALQIPESFLTTMGIVLETITPGNLSAEIQAPATVSAAPNGQAVVTA